MLNIKKMIALNIVAFVTLLCLAKWQTKSIEKVCDAGCVKTSAAFPKATDFSIINILSLKFR